MAATDLADYVKALVDEAPPLSAGQRANLSRVLTPAPVVVPRRKARAS